MDQKIPVDPELAREYRHKFGMRKMDDTNEVNLKPTMQDVQKKMDNKSNIVRMNNNSNENTNKQESVKNNRDETTNKTINSNITQSISNIEYKLDVHVPNKNRIIIEDVDEISIDLAKHTNKTNSDSNDLSNQNPEAIQSNSSNASFIKEST